MALQLAGKFGHDSAKLTELSGGSLKRKQTPGDIYVHRGQTDEELILSTGFY